MNDNELTVCVKVIVEYVHILLEFYVWFLIDKYS